MYDTYFYSLRLNPCYCSVELLVSAWSSVLMMCHIDQRAAPTPLHTRAG